MTGAARLRTACLLAVGLAASSPLRAEEARFIPPARRDRCPVCGMFVARYADWTAEILFLDGGYAVFDGVKDLARYWADMGRFAPGRDAQQVRAVFVTDYYTLRPVDARPASFVLGSDVLGPMGRELIPFERREDAEGFLADHRGERIVGFREIADVLPDLMR